MARGTYSTSNYFSRTSAVKTEAPLTLVCWVNSSAFTSFQTLLALGYHGSAAHYGLDICVNTSGTPYARRIANVTATYVTNQAPGPGNLSTSTWHHVAGVFESTSSRYCYLDGTAGSQGTTAMSMSFAPSRTSGGLWLRNGTSNPCTYATLAEAAIYDVALTAAEIAQLADGFSPLLVRPNDLLAYWPLVRGDASGNEPDAINGYALTETGTVGVQTHAPKLILPRRSQRWIPPAPATGNVGLGRRMVIAQAGGVVAGDALTQTRKMVIAQAGGVVGLGGATVGRGAALSAGGLRNAPGGVTAGRGAHLAPSGGAVTGGALTAGRGAAVSVGGSVAAGSLVLLARREVLAAAGGVAGGAGVVTVALRGMTVGASSVALAAAGLMLLEQVAQVAGVAAGGVVVAQRGEGEAQLASSMTGGVVTAQRGEGQQGSATAATGASATLAEGLGSAVQAGVAAGGVVVAQRGEAEGQTASSATGGVVTVPRGEGATVVAAAARLASATLAEGRGVSAAASSVALATEIVAKQLVLAVGASAGTMGVAVLQRAVTAQITAIVLAQAAVVLSVELEDTETATALRNAAVEFLSEFGIVCYIPFGVNYDADLSLDRSEGLAASVQAQRLANLVLALTRNQTAAGVAVNAAATALVETLSVAAAGHSATAAGLAAALMLGLSSEASRGVGVDVDLSLLHTIGVASRAVATGWLPLASQRVLTADGGRVVEVGVSLESIFRFWADAGATTAILLHLERMVAQGGTALVGAGGGLIAGRGERVTAAASAGITAGVALAEGRALSVVSRAEGYSVVVVEVAQEIAALGRATATATVAQIVRADLGLDATARAEVGVVFALLGFLEVDGRVFAAVGLSEDRTLRMRARQSTWRVAIRSRLWRVAADSRRWRLEARQWLWDVPVRSRVWIVSSKN